VSGRLATHLIVGGLLRLAESHGGFGAVLATGDRTAGTIMVILAEKGRIIRVLERVLRGGEGYSWQEVATQAAGNEDEFKKFLSRRRKFDPDMWILELDTASAERFAAEMNAID
jgi:hypothetical protein